MGIEDQKEEREVLESIFPDEITDVSETEFRIAITLDDGRHEDDESEEEQRMRLHRLSRQTQAHDYQPSSS
jgi:hypothetical protein